jgi:hypothetical protein
MIAPGNAKTRPTVAARWAADDTPRQPYYPACKVATA